MKRLLIMLLALALLPWATGELPDRAMPLQAQIVPWDEHGYEVSGDGWGNERRLNLASASASVEAGMSGDFTATSLSPSATWASGGNSGAFTWSYPITVPPAPGLQPSVTLSYSSSAVDGRSDATNNQPSVVGEGFDYSPGFIERRYVPCSQDMKGGANNTQETGDQCWRSDNATMSLNGGGGELIYETGKGWHSRTEDGSRIEKLTGAGNGDNDGEYWKVTTTDGTQYFFGLHNLPGQSSATGSTYTSPVFGNHAGEPCRGGTFATSSCVQAYRWNLDYVVDVYGNTMSFWYEQESNRYGRNNTASDDVSYTRAGILKRIDYGTYYRTQAEHGIEQVSVSPVSQVHFSYSDRCLANCWSGADPVKESWPDTPVDKRCAESACPQLHSPTFWTMKRLTGISTKVLDTTVNSWTLGHSFPSPGDGTHAGLWLDSIQRTGHVGGTITMPPVTFQPVSLPNRVISKSNASNNWHRISNIITETGAKIHVDYSQPECTSGNLPSAPHTNTMRCYPVLVEEGETLVTQWWHKHMVTDVFELDVPLSDGHQAVTKHTAYTYVGMPAWRYADDDGLSKPDRKTWSQYRGYATVETRVGDEPSSKSLQRTTYLRGMHGDRAGPSGGTATVTVPASLGSETVHDEDAFAGMIRELVIYNGVDHKPVSKTVSVPWQSDPTASRSINDSTVHARYIGPAATYQATALGVDGARGWRVSGTRQHFDHTYGTVDWSQDDGDIDISGDEQCVKHTHNRNGAKNITAKVRQTTTTALRCDQDPASVDDLISNLRYYYDGTSSPTTEPVYGSITKTERLKDWTADTGTEWQTLSQAGFDKTGRVVSSTDLKSNTSSTAYSPAVGGPVTRVSTTGPLGWVTHIDQKPYWGTAWKLTDPNGKVTEEAEFDALGRTTKVWSQGWPKAGHESQPSAEYSYHLAPDRDNYPYVKTRTLNADGNYVDSFTILDGLLRTRQTQTPSLNNDGGRVVADTIYDDQGRAAVSYAPHAEPGTASGTLWWEPEWSVPTVTRTEFDRASRATAVVLLSGDEVTNLVEKWRTVTAHEGDLIRSTPPDGGITIATVSDVGGRTVERRQHNQTAFYEYNRKGQLAKLIDAAGNEWVYTYDPRGRKVTDLDPDKGLTILEYNDADELIKTTDAREEVLYTAYDQLGRKKELRDDSAAGPLRASWRYDTLYFGKPGYRGQLTEAVRYEPAGSSNAYKWQVRSLNDRYQPGGINIVVPSAEAGLGGTYIYEYEYSSFTGAQTSTTYPAAGDVPSEKLTTDYHDVTGLPTTLGTNWGAQIGSMAVTTVNAFGQPVLTTRKMPGGLHVQDATTYDPATRRVTNTAIQPETAAGMVSARSYTYFDAGTIKSIDENPAVGSRDLQCFSYDDLARLTHAWTPMASVGCGPAPAVGNLGGPASYWYQWGFDTAGNRTSEIVHAGGAASRSYTLPAGGEGVVRPHAVTAMTAGTAAYSYAYDAAGNMTCRPSSTAANNCTTPSASHILDWNAEGKLHTVSAGGPAIETNIYDANGSRIVRRDSTGTTLYLPGQEIRREGTVNKGTRYYTLGASVIGSRNSAGLTWLYSDHQGTQQVSVNAATQAVTVRRQTPYGSPRGAQPAWANGKGFVGGDNDPTGLVNVGARQYDPALGRFISVDPLMVADDPMQWDAYQYGADNPITKSDPTGTCVVDLETDRCESGTNKQLRDQWHVAKRREQKIDEQFRQYWDERTAVTGEVNPYECESVLKTSCNPFDRGPQMLANCVSESRVIAKDCIGDRGDEWIYRPSEEQIDQIQKIESRLSHSLSAAGVLAQAFEMASLRGANSTLILFKHKLAIEVSPGKKFSQGLLIFGFGAAAATVVAATCLGTVGVGCGAAALIGGSVAASGLGCAMEDLTLPYCAVKVAIDLLPATRDSFLSSIK